METEKFWRQEHEFIQYFIKKNEGHLVHITYKIFYWALELTNFLQCLVVPLDFVDVHGQVLEDKTKDPFCLETN